MKLKKIAASIMAAAVALSAFAFSASAEEAKDEKLSLLTSEFDAKTKLVFVEGVGLIDITGAEIDSSENTNADEDANFDVDFDSISYLSKEDLKKWQETGELTLTPLKADFDTTGLKLGMFTATNGYVQLIKMEDQKAEGSEEEENVVTYRGLYKVENGEIKKLCDLDTFWTSTRDDGISVGFDLTEKDVTIIDGDGPQTFVSNVEFKMVVTQPDGKKTETVIAKANDFDSEIKLPLVHNDEDNTDHYDHSVLEDIYELGEWSCFTDVSGDLLASVVFEMSPLSDRVTSEGDRHYEVAQLYKDGTYKKIYEENGSYLDGFLSSENDEAWYDHAEETGGLYTVHAYNSKTGEVESYGYETFEKDENGDPLEDWFSCEEAKDPSWGLDIEDYNKNYTIAYLDVSSKGVSLAEGYALFSNLSDLDNWQSKTYYEKIVHQGSIEDADIFRFITKDGKTGYMDINGKVLAEFDAADDFEGNYVPVVKDGKAYLIDKDMNAVSTEIEADDVAAICDELFIAKSGDKTYFVSYTKETAEPSDSNSSGSGTTSPETGAAGLSLTLGVITLAGAAIVVSRKKTR